MDLFRRYHDELGIEGLTIAGIKLEWSIKHLDPKRYRFYLTKTFLSLSIRHYPVVVSWARYYDKLHLWLNRGRKIDRRGDFL